MGMGMRMNELYIEFTGMSPRGLVLFIIHPGYLDFYAWLGPIPLF